MNVYAELHYITVNGGNRHRLDECDYFNDPLLFAMIQ